MRKNYALERRAEALRIEKQAEELREEYWNKFNQRCRYESLEQAYYELERAARRVRSELDRIYWPIYDRADAEE